MSREIVYAVYAAQNQAMGFVIRFSHAQYNSQMLPSLMISFVFRELEMQ